MTVDATAPGDDPVDAQPGQQVLLTRTPRAGELAPRWRLVTAVTWIAVAVAIGSVWKTSDQLGRSTWWIGPRGQQHPLVVQMLPFLPALVMLVGTINHWRRLAVWGAVASIVSVAVGILDLPLVARIGAIEIAIGVAALVVSIASSTGTFRPIDAGDEAEESAATGSPHRAG
jgi:hypothetical protein